MEWTAVLPIVGTLLGVGAGVLLNSSKDHRKWIREKRYESYVKVLEAMRAFTLARQTEAREEATRNLINTLRAAEMIAPTTVRYAILRCVAYAVGSSTTDASVKAFATAREEVLQAMRRDLRIQQRTFKEVVGAYWYRLRHPKKAREVQQFDYLPQTAKKKPGE